MAMNWVQFQAGMSLSEFLEQYGSEEQCEQALEKARWPDGYHCPRCGCREASVFRVSTRKYRQCRNCRHQTSLRAGTIFHGSRLPLAQWFQGMFLMSQSKNSVSALEMHRLLGISYPAAWRLKHKLMQVMAEREADRMLEDDVVIDDAYLGGEHRGKAGRGSENKVPFVAAVQLDEEGHPLWACFTPVKGFTKDAIGEWSRRHLSASCRVVSDGLNCFLAVTQSGANHRPEIVGKTRRSTDMPCFAWINILIGNLKTGISGTYHAFKFQKYAHRYLSERQYLFNRRFGMKTLIRRLLVAGAQTEPRPEKWLRSADRWC